MERSARWPALGEAGPEGSGPWGSPAVFGPTGPSTGPGTVRKRFRMKSSSRGEGSKFQDPFSSCQIGDDHVDSEDGACNSDGGGDDVERVGVGGGGGEEGDGALTTTGEEKMER